MAETKKADSKKIVDVAHPGQSAPAGNSKSIIVTNRPIMKDPMMVEEKTSDAPKSSSKQEHAPDPELPRSVETKIEAPVKSSPVQPPPAPEDPEPKTEAEAPAPTAAPDDDQTAAPAAKDTKAVEAEAAEAAKHQAAIDKLVESKQYYLPINSVEKRRTKRFVLLGVALSLLLAVAWVDVALDAGLIQLGGIKPVTHLFSN